MANESDDLHENTIYAYIKALKKIFVIEASLAWNPNLRTLAEKIDTAKMKKPSFLMVLTGVGDYAYKRPDDGVLVVPIGCLKD